MTIYATHPKLGRVIVGENACAVRWDECPNELPCCVLPLGRVDGFSECVDQRELSEWVAIIDNAPYPTSH